MLCNSCQIDMPETEFYERKPGFRRKTCRYCTLDRNKAYKEAVERGEDRSRPPAQDRRVYIAQWRENLMQQAREKLGGICEGCGTAQRLQFDHIDPRTKTAEVATVLTRMGIAEFWLEVGKCQLLCVDCHRLKTRSEREPGHGSERRYAKPWQCRCPECLEGAHKRNRGTAQARAMRAGRSYTPRGPYRSGMP